MLWGWSWEWTQELLWLLSAICLALLALAGILMWRLRRDVRALQESRRTLETQVELRALELEERNQQLEAMTERLQDASITDPLTGLLNRRSFFEFVSRQVAAVERDYTGLESLVKSNKRHLFLMVIDLDDFKPINDTYGSNTGDHTLVQVAELLTSCAREADTVFRWGDDEFFVIGQVQDILDLAIVAERYRNTIAEHRFDPKFGRALRLSASIGVAPYPFCADNPGLVSWEQVANLADLAQQLAKTHGKNAWVSVQGTQALTNHALHHMQENVELLIEGGMIRAMTSDIRVPIPGANPG